MLPLYCSAVDVAAAAAFTALLLVLLLLTLLFAVVSRFFGGVISRVGWWGSDAGDHPAGFEGAGVPFPGDRRAALPEAAQV